MAGLGVIFGGAGLALRLHDAAGAARAPAAAGESAQVSAAQISDALHRIGQARASAFATLSQPALLQADQPHSPAERADLALIQRLRQRGYRLVGVRYDLGGVQVIGRDGDAVRVRAMVTTSGHEQVRIQPRESASVPPDGPRAVVFTVVPAASGSAGATGWRVENVSALT